MGYPQNTAVRCSSILQHVASLLRCTELRIAASGISWRGDDSGKIVNIENESIKWAQWMRVARNYQLRISYTIKDKGDRKTDTFDGFIREVRPFFVSIHVYLLKLPH